MAKHKETISYQTAIARRAKRNKYYKLLFLLLFFIIWELFCRLNLAANWMDAKFIPMPTGILASGFAYSTAGTLFGHIGVSIRRVLTGYGAGIMIAALLGSLIASYHSADNIISPVLNLFGPIPVMAFLPMFILWFGIGEKSKYILIAYSVAIYMVSYVTEGIKNTDPVLIRSAVSLGATPLQVFLRVRLQSALPVIFQGMKGALGAAFGAMVVAEMMGASTGLGYIIVFSKNWFKMNDMIMAAILIGLLYSLFFGVVSLIESRLFPWRTNSADKAVEK